MQKETEIKLRVSRETLAALREHPLLKKRNKSGWERRELMNQYFDTPERDLAQAKVALRLRKDGDEIIQTLKTRGQSVAGLSERNEYNWDLPKAKLDVKKLDGECWPEQLAELDKKTLKPIFTTDFVRERAEITWGRGKAKVVIEAALDLGHVVVGKQKEEICELELELREGEPAALLELAAELAATPSTASPAGSTEPAPGVPGAAGRSRKRQSPLRDNNGASLFSHERAGTRRPEPGPLSVR